MDIINARQIETPWDLYTVQSEGTMTSLLSAFYARAAEVISDPFTITDYAQDDASGKWTIKLLLEDDRVHELDIPYQDLQDEIDLSTNRQVQRAFTESIGVDVPTFKDGYTRAATHFFETHQIEESKLLGSWISSRPRLVVTKGMIHLTKGFSKIEAIFRRIFQPKMMAEWEEQNREAMDAYVSFLEREVGRAKLSEIQKIYGFDFAKMREKGLPLEPKHIYFCNIGMNNIEMNDVTRLGSRVSLFLASNRYSDQLLPLLRGGDHPFTMREARAILEKLGKEATVADLHIALGGVQGQPFPSEYFTEKTFGKLVSLLETPAKDWESLYTGRKFMKIIRGAYNEEVTDRNTFRPWVDQQELLQVFQEMKDPFPGETPLRKKVDHYFYEALTKIVVKKHLMRSLEPDNWEVGALIPSPYKNDQGETIYYRVDQGVDSGHGKMWYVFRPACEDYDSKYPVIRAPRDTTPDRYAMRGGPTLTRDLGKDAGAQFSSTTLKEDRALFREFTLPVWMGHFALAMKTLERVQANGPYEDLIPHLKNVHAALQVEVSKRIHEKKMTREEGAHMIESLSAHLQGVETLSGQDQLLAVKHYIATVLTLAPYDADDFYRFTKLVQGQPPRPLASIGNSLGGFDAQNDLVRQTFAENRIPITNLDLYTHSTLKIDDIDDALFTNFILCQKELLKQLDVHLSFHHVTELDDIVSLATKGTFLGKGLQMAAEQEARTGGDFPIDVSLHVFKVIPFSDHEQIHETEVHLRRIEHLEKGKDYISISQFRSIKDYDDYGLSYRFKGRRLEAWRKTGISLNLAETSELIWRAWRYFFKLAHPIPKKHANDKLVVTYNPVGERQHTFIRTHLTPNLDKLFYQQLPIISIH
ncbi:MAG: hypothetical protein H7A38_02060 [Chlamydiales bacterium]|nr:hypothetical protein [Chlamydiales bacterium]